MRNHPVVPSALGAIEGAYFAKTGKLVQLSEQQLVACYKKSCQSGEPILVFERYATVNGMCTSASYPYTPPSGKPYPPPPPLVCLTSNCTVGVLNGTVTGGVAVPVKSELDLMKAVAQHPVSVTIDSDGLNNYRVSR